LIELVWAYDTHNAEIFTSLTRYVSREIGGGDRGFGNCKVMGVFDNDAFLGAVVFHNYEPTSGVIEISAAAESKRWLGRKALDRIFTYAFEDCACQMVAARIAETNVATQRIFERYGFSRYVIPRLRGRHESECIFTLTDDDWRNGRFYPHKD
jgi:RimJ/RimL family protein N-acetyltransferase